MQKIHTYHVSDKHSLVISCLTGGPTPVSRKLVETPVTIRCQRVCQVQSAFQEQSESKPEHLKVPKTVNASNAGSMKTNQAQSESKPKDLKVRKGDAN